VNGYNVAINGEMFPVQPGFEAAVNSYVEKIVEWNPITQNAAIFYQFTTKQMEGQYIQILPDGCMDMLFCCSAEKPAAIIYGKKVSSKSIALERGCTYFGFRPMSVDGLKQNAFSMKEIVNDEISFSEVFSDNGLIERLTQAAIFEKRINEFKQYLKNHFVDQDFKMNLSYYCFLQICRSQGNIKIEQIARNSGYSERYLRKKYEEIYGISPKKFAQIVMFQGSLNKIIKNNISKMDIVYENGYYDQSHLIHQFKKFTTTAPTEFIRLIDRMSC